MLRPLLRTLIRPAARATGLPQTASMFPKRASCAPVRVLMPLRHTSSSSVCAASAGSSSGSSSSSPVHAASETPTSSAPGPGGHETETAVQRARRLRLTPGTPEFSQPAPEGLSPDELREEMRIRAEAVKGPPPSMRFTPQVIVGIAVAAAAVVALLQHLGDRLVPDAMANSPLSPQWAYDQHRRAAGLPPRKLTPDEEREFRVRQQFRQLQRLNIQQAITIEESGGAGAPEAMIAEVKASNSTE